MLKAETTREKSLKKGVTEKIDYYTECWIIETSPIVVFPGEKKNEIYQVRLSYVNLNLFLKKAVVIIRLLYKMCLILDEHSEYILFYTLMS